jgi:tetratricopeptide (TPR) repeat protein
MQRVAMFALGLALAAVACGGPQLKEHTVDISKHVPATLDAQRAREGDPRTVKVRVWADPAVRATPKWKEDLGEQIDYASQLLTPLIGARLSVESIKDWPRTGDPHDALRALTELDKGDGVTWVIGFIAPGDVASKAMSELGDAKPLGHHVIVRAWAETPESEALNSSLPDLKEAERGEILAAHRRHKQTVVLLHHLAITLGGIDEADPAWILHPTYSSKQSGFADRTTELLTIGIDARLAEETDQVLAKKLLEAIEKAEWGGWIAAHKEEVATRLRNVIDANKAGKTASDLPPEAYDHVTRIKELARRGDAANAISDLENLLSAYPGNASMHQLKCEILLGKPGVADPATRTACKRVSDLAPGDPSPHVAVGEALAKAGDTSGARAELAQAEGKIVNLPANADAAWRRVIAVYQTMGSLTWTEDAIAKAKLDKDPIAASLAQTRARYGVPRGSKVVAPDQEAALVSTVKKGLELVYKSKYDEAEKALAAGEKKWPGAPGLAAARCDLALRMGQVPAARASCERALAADPNESWALYLSGVLALREASGTKTGIEQLKKAIAVDPELGQAWRTLAKAYDRAKDKAALDQLAKDYQARFNQNLPR